MSASVVTCYYRVSSKHTHDKYDEWITNFLPNIPCQLIVFTSPDLVDYIRDKRGIHMDKTVIIPIELESLPLYQEYLEFWDSQYQMDNQKDTKRTKECYILWNSKLRFLKQAIELNPFSSDKFVWTDIGCLRSSHPNIIFNLAQPYPIYDKISNTHIDIVLIHSIDNCEQKVFIDEVHFSGAMFGGHKDNILVFHDLFYKRFDEHIRQNIFIGCDQQTISSVYNDNRELFHCISSKHMRDDWEWFYLWIHYS